MGVQRIKRGDVYLISIGEGLVAYAVALQRPLYGFFDVFSESPVAVESLIELAFAFRCCVHDQAIKTGRWIKVGSYVPEKELDKMLYFKKDLISGNLETYCDDGHEAVRLLTREEARQLEPAAVWSAEQVEDRLRDHFARQPNKLLISMVP
jgi:hypothetical protein